MCTRDKLKQAVILIVGGVNELTMRLTNAFLDKDAVVVVPARSLAEITKMKHCIGDKGNGNLITQLTDLPDFDQAVDILTTIAEKFGKIDLVVSYLNTYQYRGLLSKVAVDDWSLLMDEEISPFFMCARVAVNQMIEKKHGVFISVIDSPFLNNTRFTALEEIALSFKIELSKIFAKEAIAAGVRYYHLWLQHIANPDQSTYKEKLQAVDTELCSKQIMGLYDAEVYNSYSVFQLFPQ